MGFDSVFGGDPTTPNVSASGEAAFGIDLATGQLYYRNPQDPNVAGWQACAGGGGGTNPGGSSGQVQYNDSGVFGGAVGLTINNGGSISASQNFEVLANLDMSESNGNFLLGNGVLIIDSTGSGGTPGQVFSNPFGSSPIWGGQTGQATLEASTTSIAVDLVGTSWTSTSQPVVTVTPTSNPGAFYWVTYSGSADAWTGFTIHIASAPDSPVIFNYTVGYNAAE